MSYEIRNPDAADFWSRVPSAQTFSYAIGKKVEKGHKPAAIYRVRGRTALSEDVRRLADRLVSWLNDPAARGADRCPFDVPCASDEAAQIVLTKAGRAAGWLAP